MAKFEEEKVINALHIDKAEVGKRYWVSDNILNLKERVESDATEFVATLTQIEINESYVFRDEDCCAWEFLYPYEEQTKKTWLEETYGDEAWITDDIDGNEIRISAIEDFSKKLLEETKKMWQEDSDYFSDLEGIIKNLGVEV